MKNYSWSALDAHGHVHTGWQHAEDRADLEHALTQRFATVLAIRPTWQACIDEYRLKRACTDALAQTITHDLAFLLASHIPLAAALESLQAQSRNQAARTILKRIARDVTRGQSLAIGLQHHLYLDPSLVAAIKAGEASGRAARTLELVSAHLDATRTLRKKIAQALLMPVLTLLMSCGVLAGILLYVMPQFEQFYRALDKPIPPEIATLLAARLWLMQPQVAISFMLGAAALIGLVLWMRHCKKELLDRIIIRVPLLASWTHNQTQAFYFKLLSLLVDAHLPLAQALGLSARVIKNSAVRAQFEAVANAVTRGTTVADALHYAHCDDVLVGFFTLGTAAGNLPKMLHVASAYATQRYQALIRRITTHLQPLLIIGVGGVIALLLWHVYIPLFSCMHTG